MAAKLFLFLFHRLYGLHTKVDFNSLPVGGHYPGQLDLGWLKFWSLGVTLSKMSLLLRLNKLSC